MCLSSEVKTRSIQPPDFHSSLEAHGQWILNFPATGRMFGDLQMLRILGRGHLASTVTALIFVRAQRLDHFAIKAFYALLNNNLICRFSEQQLDVKCFSGKMVKRSRCCIMK
jgi:hypothetical protein